MTESTGSFAALVGIALFGVGVLVATGAGFVILFRLKKPGTDGVARKVLLGAGVVGALGLALFAWAAMGGR
jgi:energy-converting hydrogenase Eha subunit H